VFWWKPPHRLTEKGRCPLLLTEIFQKLKGVLNTQIFQIQGLSNMYQREEKLERRRRLKLGGWGYAPPDFAILRHKYWNFCRWGADVPPDETSLATRSKEKRLYSQARIIENYCWQRQTCMYLIINNTFFFHSRRQTKGKRTQMSYLVAVHLHDRCPSSISASKISKVTENWN